MIVAKVPIVVVFAIAVVLSGCGNHAVKQVPVTSPVSPGVTRSGPPAAASDTPGAGDEAQADKAAQELAELQASIPFRLLLPPTGWGGHLVGARLVTPPGVSRYETDKLHPEWRMVTLTYRTEAGPWLELTESNGSIGLEGTAVSVAGHPGRYVAGRNVRQLWVDFQSVQVVISAVTDMGGGASKEDLIRFAETLRPQK